MDIVNIHCSACGGLIGVRQPNLGRQVRCPRCRQVILATAPESAPAGASPYTEESSPEFMFAPVAVEEHESIFTPPEATSEDVFGQAPAPKIEMPPDAESPTEPANKATSPAGNDWAEKTDIMPPVDLPTAPSPPEYFPQAAFPNGPGANEASAFTSLPAAARAATRLPEPHSHAESEPDGMAIVAPERHRVRRPSMLVPILLIFLIPYSVLTTGFIAYMIWAQRGLQPHYDPLERMLEDSKDGRPGIKRVQHDLPVSPKLRTGLKEPLRVGAIEVEPLRIVLTPPGDLILFLRVRNTSQDLLFNPMPAKYTQYTRGTMATFKPYTFLEAEGRPPRVYGGDLQWWKGPQGKQRASDGELLPGAAMTVQLTTDAQDRKQVKTLLAGKPGPLLWRVLLRRGLEVIAGQDRVITCVIGVHFRPDQIEKS